jgi:hypothetical protein
MKLCKRYCERALAVEGRIGLQAALYDSSTATAPGENDLSALVKVGMDVPHRRQAVGTLHLHEPQE